MKDDPILSGMAILGDIAHALAEKVPGCDPETVAVLVREAWYSALEQRVSQVMSITSNITEFPFIASEEELD